MQDLAKLSELAEAEIEKLRADGIDLTPPDIIEINALGWAVESPETRRLLARGAPVAVGGVYLWPMSLYAQEWFNRVGCNLSDNTRQAYALAYAMAHGRDEGEPLATEGRAAEKIVTRWAKSLKCTFGELNVAISQILQQDEDHEQPPGEDTGGMSMGDFSAFLAAACPGSDPDFWERRCAAGYTHAVLSAIVRQNSAEGKKTLADPRLKAERALGYKIEQIKKSRKEETQTI
ncbi:MAG: hypothetical protein WC374_06405 [Phycisphaerae bacterium]|jgi:hypothetical protein